MRWSRILPDLRRVLRLGTPLATDEGSATLVKVTASLCLGTG